MTEFAKTNNLKIVDTIMEQKSAYKRGRPGFNLMIQRVKKGEANGILTYHLTRLARNSGDTGDLIDLMDAGLLEEIRTVDAIHYNNGNDKFMMNMQLAMAKKSSDDTSQFVKRDIETKTLKGEITGPTPLGYLNLDRRGAIAGRHHSQEKQMILYALGRPLKREEIDPITGPLVRRVFEEASKATYSLKTLTDLSFKLGLRSKNDKKLPQATIWNILKNPYYYGAIRLREKVYIENIQHEPLISKQLFDRVQQVLSRRGGGMKRHFFPYTGIFKCGECECSITAEIQRGHIYYHCTHKKGDCSQRTFLKSEILEEQLVDVIQRLVIPTSFLEFAFKKLKDSHKAESQLQNAARQSLERRYGVLKAERDALLSFKISSENAKGELLSNEEYLEKKEAINNEMHELEQQRESYKKDADTWVKDCETFILYTQDMANKYGMSTLEQKKELMFLLCSKATIRDSSVAFSYREPFASIAKLSEVTRGRLEQPSSLPLKKDSSSYKKWLLELDSNQQPPR